MSAGVAGDEEDVGWAIAQYNAIALLQKLLLSWNPFPIFCATVDHCIGKALQQCQVAPDVISVVMRIQNCHKPSIQAEQTVQDWLCFRRIDNGRLMRIREIQHKDVIV